MNKSTPTHIKPIRSKTIRSIELPRVKKIHSFCSIPGDILYEIAGYLEVIDFIHFSLTHKLSNKVLSDRRFIQNAEARTRQIAHQVVIKRESIFITGPGGVGKSYTLQYIHQYAKKKNLTINMTAATGIAASNLPEGRTLHSFSGLKLAKITLEQIQAIFDDGKTIGSVKLWITTDILVIDEISMIPRHFFEKLDLCARHHLKNNKPFGGIQLVLCGDFYQLSPVGGTFVFRSLLWNKLHIPIIQLTIPVRQTKDQTWFNLLNDIRKGNISEENIERLKSRLIPIKDEDLISGKYGTILVPTNMESNNLNNKAFDLNPSMVISRYEAFDEIYFRTRLPNGRYEYTPSLGISIKYAQKKIAKQMNKTPDIIELKHNTLYVMTKNIDVKNGYVNGLQCKFDEIIGKMITLKGEELPLKVFDRIKTRYPVEGDYYLLRYQIPFRLGHSLTIHSSQGMTLTKACVNAGKQIFSPGQIYVALSRLESMSGLLLLDFDEKK